VKMSCRARAQRALTVWVQCLQGAAGNALLRRSAVQCRTFRYERDRLVEPVHPVPLRRQDALGKFGFGPTGVAAPVGEPTAMEAFRFQKNRDVYIPS